MINNIPRYNLKQIVQRDPTIYKEPKKCRNMLNDYCPECKKEISVLITVAEEGGVEELLRGRGTIPYNILEARCLSNLSNKTAIDDRFLRWAIQSWAFAFNMVTEESLNRTTIETVNQTPPKTSKDYKADDKTANAKNATSTKYEVSNNNSTTNNKTYVNKEQSERYTDIIRKNNYQPKKQQKKTSLAFPIIIIVALGIFVFYRLSDGKNSNTPSSYTSSQTSSGTETSNVNSEQGTDTTASSEVTVSTGNDSPAPVTTNENPISNLGIKVIQDNTAIDITQHLQEVSIKKDAFTIRFNLRPYDSVNEKFYAARFAAVPNEESFNLINTNVPLADANLFFSAASLATSGPYGGIAVSNIYSHYVIYDETEERAQRAVLVEKNNDILTLDYDIPMVSLEDEEENEEFYDVKDLPVNNLYIVIYIDNDLDEIIDDDEYAKIKITFQQ